MSFNPSKEGIIAGGLDPLGIFGMKGGLDPLGLFTPPEIEIPPLPPVEPVPTMPDPEGQQRAKRSSIARQRARSGRVSTIFTHGLGG